MDELLVVYKHLRCILHAAINGVSSAGLNLLKQS